MFYNEIQNKNDPILRSVKTLLTLTDKELKAIITEYWANIPKDIDILIEKYQDEKEAYISVRFFNERILGSLELYDYFYLQNDYHCFGGESAKIFDDKQAQYINTIMNHLSKDALIEYKQGAMELSGKLADYKEKQLKTKVEKCSKAHELAQKNLYIAMIENNSFNRNNYIKGLFGGVFASLPASQTRLNEFEGKEI